MCPKQRYKHLPALSSLFSDPKNTPETHFIGTKARHSIGSHSGGLTIGYMDLMFTHLHVTYFHFSTERLVTYAASGAAVLSGCHSSSWPLHALTSEGPLRPIPLWWRDNNLFGDLQPSNQAYHCRPSPNEEIPFTSLFPSTCSFLHLYSFSIIQPSIHPLLWPSGDLRSCRRLRHHQQLVERHGYQRGTVSAVVELLLLLLLLLVLVLLLLMLLLLLLLLLLLSSCHRVIVSWFGLFRHRPASSRNGATSPVVKAAAVSADCLDCALFWMVSMVSKKSDTDMNGFDSCFYSFCRISGLKEIEANTQAPNKLILIHSSKNVKANGV